MKLGSKKNYTRKLDALFSKKIRSLGYCQKCKKKNVFLQCAHVISRTNRTLRWDEKNALCFCSSCHFWGHQDPLGFALYIEKTFPKRYRYLMENKNKITKRSAFDLRELYEKEK